MKSYEELLSDIEEDMELMGSSHIVYSMEEDGVVTDYDYLLMDIGCHTGKCRHGLTLASGCDQNHLVVRIILHLIDLDQCVLRDLQIAKL